MTSGEGKPEREAPKQKQGPVVEGHERGLLAAQHSEQASNGGG